MNKILKHLEEGGVVKHLKSGRLLKLGNLISWDLDPIYNPQDFEIVGGK